MVSIKQIYDNLKSLLDNIYAPKKHGHDYLEPTNEITSGNLDDYTQPGIWTCTANNYSNLTGTKPFAQQAPIIIQNIKYKPNIVVQFIYPVHSSTNINHIYKRIYNGEWEDWINITDDTNIPNTSSTTPKADIKDGKVGSGTTWAKADHQHPLSNAYATSGHDHDGTYLKSYTPPTASISQAGIVQLNNAIDSNSETTAATSKAVQEAYNKFSNAEKEKLNTLTTYQIMLTAEPSINYYEDNYDYYYNSGGADNNTKVLLNTLQVQRSKNSEGKYVGQIYCYVLKNKDKTTPASGEVIFIINGKTYVQDINAEGYATMDIKLNATQPNITKYTLQGGDLEWEPVVYTVIAIYRPKASWTEAIDIKQMIILDTHNNL